ncbi:18.5 kDa class I heat shock protein-like [Pyrus ussuriensis x Pyrus communis]|uniref:18.5 kDa class I heat shock protein-like n=1 Tax=Pyrus ussuriensis x Pyrus communis TaxID=2448454 RepID=A0A5N5G007_9ROSA|nr:18.5 kDa class I heat shock protein-like [Pyrus ussuriensis x Pyrus communis]
MSLIPNSRRGSSIFDPFCLNLWDPFKDFPSPSSSSLSAFPEFSRENSAFMNTRVDWKETLEAHVFKTDILGLKKDERNMKKDDKNDKWHIVEKSSDKFLGRFQLPKNVTVDHIKAAMENGVLSVTVQKAEVKKPDVKAIEIEVN